MSLKRKASFSGMSSPNTLPNNTALSLIVDDSPKHLNCRTRKRFRDGRPDDKVVHENTLRWLFTAQQRQGSTPPADQDEDANMDSDSLPSAIVDPRQQTLHKFFQPSRTSSSQSRPNHMKQQSDNISQANNTIFLHRHDLGSISNITSIDGSAARPSTQETATDMEVQMDSAKIWNGRLSCCDLTPIYQRSE
ncbi:hypothetical protein BDV29DRAFT_149340 [Aspergillus leporis]|uniref:Uncharacterized protein n=1 Tax=Aspergillus leporis TaxID=41062 RepID=A0A5N5WVI1_9EURO|nr:hypothetical protein BDV29DRAFT_149340 [Aspergillus leporis]